MYLTRPKSSKGRSRPAVNVPLYSGQNSPPKAPESSSRPDGPLRSHSQPAIWPSSQTNADQVLHGLHRAPTAPLQSLNKYKVLPSIERRQSQTILDKMAELDLCDETDSCSPDGDDALASFERPPAGSKEAGPHGSLLLAIRAPCGRRFLEHFDPSDTLRTVKYSAERRFDADYPDASIETVDVPRRVFTRLDVTLGQCGIVNRSVLCISRNDQRGEEEG